MTDFLSKDQLNILRRVAANDFYKNYDFSDVKIIEQENWKWDENIWYCNLYTESKQVLLFVVFFEKGTTNINDSDLQVLT